MNEWGDELVDMGASEWVSEQVPERVGDPANKWTHPCVRAQGHSVRTDIGGESDKCEIMWNVSPRSTSLVKANRVIPPRG